MSVARDTEKGAWKVVKKIVAAAVAAAVVMGIVCFKTVPVNVSMFELINHPEKYDGRRVRVVGVGQIQFEGNELFITKVYYQSRLSSRGLRLACTDEIWLETDNNDWAEYNGEYVVVVGRFDKDNTGHLGRFVGAIDNISRYEKLNEEGK